MQKPSRSDVHQTVTAAIIKMLETADKGGGAFPWCRPGVSQSRPTNALTSKRYSGINVLSLWGAADARSYRTGLWATFKQWQELGAQVRKGEKATPIVFYKSIDLKDDTAEPVVDGDEQPKSIRIAKGYWGFNADQVDGFTVPDLPTVDLTVRLEHAERYAAALRIPIENGGTRAFYRPSEDRIQMPDRVLFQSTPTSTATEGYYGVLYHECGHATAATHRLSRDLTGRFGSSSYAMEEMIAEWCAALVCAEVGITAQPRPDHAHYIANWLTVLKSDASAALNAAAKASQAADYLHGLQPDTASSASRQHFIDTGHYLTNAETETSS